MTFNRGSCTDAVAAAGAREEFDTGPGGGFVFYDAGTRQSWGQYLEAAPPEWSDRRTDARPDPVDFWCLNGSTSGIDPQSFAKDTIIGSGAANTAQIIKVCGQLSAAWAAASYRGGGKTDWFLPSLDELEALGSRRSEAGVHEGDNYWSSSQSPDCFDPKQGTWCAQTYALWHPYPLADALWSEKNLVRPVRAF